MRAIIAYIGLGVGGAEIRPEGVDWPAIHVSHSIAEINRPQGRPGAAIFSNFAGLDLRALPSLSQGKATAHRVPLIAATAESLRGYARTVAQFAQAPVAIVTWPQPGWRPIVPGTGNEGGVVQDRFVMERRGEVQHAVNRAVGRSYVTGWFTDPAIASEETAAADTSRIYTHEANYHPDGGQVFSPIDGAAFVALLAEPGDDVQPADFVAFYCDGSFGIHIEPGVWHQPVFPLGPVAEFDNKQGRVHACIAVNFLSEFGCYLEVPLTPPGVKSEFLEPRS